MAPSDEGTRADESGVVMSYRRGLTLVLVLAVGIRAAFALRLHGNLPLGGDAWVLHNEARFLALRRGLIDPTVWLSDGVIRAAADQPPLYVGLLAVAYVVGLQSTTAELGVNVAVGGLTVLLVARLARRLGGDRMGLLAGLLAAVYPGLWAWNGQVLPQSLSMLMVTVTALAAYHYLELRTARRAALLAGAIGLAFLAGIELALLALLIPVLFAAHHRAGRGLAQLAGHAVVAVAVLAAVVGPWTAYNAARFGRPVPLGTGVGRDLAAGACPETLTGDAVGFRFDRCLDQVGVTPDDRRDLDQALLDDRYRRGALDAVRAGADRLPVVLAARVGRAFQLWAPKQQVRFDQTGDLREWWLSGAAFATFYLLAALAAAGAVGLWQRRIRVYPLLVPVGVAVAGALIAGGTSRARAPAEPVLVVLAAAAVEGAARRLEGRRAPPATVAAEPGDDEQAFATAEGEPEDWDQWAEEPMAVSAARGGAGAGTSWNDGRLGQDREPARRRSRTFAERWAEDEHGSQPPGVRAVGGAGGGIDDDEDAALWAIPPRVVPMPLIVLVVTALIGATGGLGAWAVSATRSIEPFRPPSVAAPGLPPP
jgi:4-amino-4-deoxy-L-arabinose transferase-like glycosyltransferase